MNDYETQKELLEMAEVLSNELENLLEVKTFNETTGKSNTVVFEFNDQKELTRIYTED